MVIKSDYVALYDPFRHYLARLPPWDGKTNPVMELSSTVTMEEICDTFDALF